DLLECSLSSGLSSQPAMQLGQMMTFGSPLINFQSSNTTLCNDCFQKAHDVQSNGDFHRKKEKAKKLVQDQLAAKAAAKSLEALKHHAQTMFDMESLTPSGQGSNYCQSQLSQSLSDKTCSGQISEKQFQDRLSLSLSEAGLAESSDPGDIAQSVLNSINPKNRPGNTCTRKDFARQKKIDFDLPQNIKYKSALKTLLDDVSVRSEVASIFTQENCENPGDKSFVDAYSEKIAQAAWDELSPLIKEEIRVGSSTNIFEGVCSKATGFFSKKICGDDGELFGLMAQQNKFAALTYQQEFPELINDSSAQNFSNFETFMTDMIKSNISSAFYVPMEMNPYLKVGLNDWEVMCESQKKLSSGKDITASVFGDLLDVGNGYMGDPVIDKFNQNECNKIATQFSESICSDPELLSNDPRDTEKNLAEIERIKSNILKNDEVDGFAMNSVVCEVKANARQLGDDTNTSQSSPISTQDLLAGGLDFDNYSGCSDETRTFQAASLGLPLIDEKGQKNFVYVPTKESYKAQRSSMLKTAASTFKNSASNKIKMALENKEQVASSPSKRVVKKIPAKSSTTRQAQAMPVSRISQTTTSTFEGERNIASNPTSSNTEDCGADCIKHSPVSSRIVMSDFEKKFAMSPNSKAVVAAPSNDERTKKLFEEILSGKLDNNELEQMKKENLALKEEIGKVKDKLASEEVPTRVLDSNGNDRTSYIPEPAKSSA
ncbi:MAG: hypothetical protein KC478_17120, partial [Bacteriovoracaceae bacterium]|nr:hypothetical protein [Bacteriovoracaceae bacterium]